jgi:Stigma-specific protein, Stig1
MTLPRTWYLCLRLMPLAALACGRSLSNVGNVSEVGPEVSNDAGLLMMTAGAKPRPSPSGSPLNAQRPEDAGGAIGDGGCAQGVVCGGECTDTNSDPSNCGGCSRACAAQQVCSDGLCRSSCRTGLTACGSACMDLSSNNANCGQCGAACGVGFRCSNGTCACPGSVCQGRCTDITEDPLNCGGCGYGCPSGDPSLIVGDNEAVLSDTPLARYCNLGLCSLYCSLGTNLCGLSCVHTESDGNNCGRCGVICAGGSSCQHGACVCANSAETVCDGLCVDTQTSSAHCGGCDSPCPAGVECVQAACAITCPVGEIACGSSCVDPLTTKEHCGLCNEVCGGNLVCTNGQCACPMGLTPCAGSCVELAEGGVCP